MRAYINQGTDLLLNTPNPNNNTHTHTPSALPPGVVRNVHFSADTSSSSSSSTNLILTYQVQPGALWLARDPTERILKKNHGVYSSPHSHTHTTTTTTS